MLYRLNMLKLGEGNTMTRTTFTLPDEQAWKLKQACLAEKISQQKMLTKLVGDFIKTYEKKHEIPACPFLNKPSKQE